MARKRLRINEEALRKQFSVRNIPIYTASSEIGYSQGYLGASIRYGYITEKVAKLLEDRYNIKPETYIVSEAEETKDQTSGIDNHVLYRVIYGAVYQAMKRALSE